MKDFFDKILISLANNTEQNQNINLFDNGDPFSGGAFKPSGGQRIIQYNLSGESFSYANGFACYITYNSAEYPITTGILTAVGINYAGFISRLNGMGLGTFTDIGGNKINAEPNYPLVSDNGGLQGVELITNNPVSDAVSFSNTIAVFDASSEFTLQPNVSTDTNNSFSITGTVSFNSSFNCIPEGNNFNFKMVGNVNINCVISLYHNGVLLQSINQTAGAVNIIYNNIFVKSGDTINVTVT